MTGSDAGSADTMAGMLPKGPLPKGNRGPALNALQIVMVVLATSAVLLRFVARRMSAAGIWYDDWMILAALVCWI